MVIMALTAHGSGRSLLFVICAEALRVQKPILVRRGDPREAGAMALLQASHHLMQSLFPPEDNHFLSVEALCLPEIAFYVAEDGGCVLGTIALARKDGYGEVKSMFVDPAARGRGVARALLAHLERDARAAGLPLLRLETGHLLEAAIALYSAQGFVTCKAFGDYAVNGSSVFMEKPLG
jgi:putative acetyltransferase